MRKPEAPTNSTLISGGNRPRFQLLSLFLNALVVTFHLSPFPFRIVHCCVQYVATAASCPRDVVLAAQHFKEQNDKKKIVGRMSVREEESIIEPSTVTLQTFLITPRTFCLAPEQRHYRWTPILASVLLDDFVALAHQDERQAAKELHYLNSVHVSIEHDVVTIYDGQQRVTTTLLVLLSIWNRLLPYSETRNAKKCAKLVRKLGGLFAERNDRALVDLRAGAAAGRELHCAEHEAFNFIVDQLLHGCAIDQAATARCSSVNAVFRCLQSRVAAKFPIAEDHSGVGRLQDVERLAILGNRILRRVLLLEVRVSRNNDQIFNVVNREGLTLDSLELLRGELVSRIDKDKKNASESGKREWELASHQVDNMLNVLYTLPADARAMFVHATSRVVHKSADAGNVDVHNAAGNAMQLLMSFYKKKTPSSVVRLCSALATIAKHYAELFDTSKQFGYVSKLVQCDPSIDLSVSVLALALASSLMTCSAPLSPLLPRDFLKPPKSLARWHKLELYLMISLAMYPTTANSNICALLSAGATNNIREFEQLLAEAGGEQLVRFLLRFCVGDINLYQHLHANKLKRSVFAYLLMRLEALSPVAPRDTNVRFRFDITVAYDIDHIVARNGSIRATDAVVARARLLRLMSAVAQHWLPNYASEDLERSLTLALSLHEDDWRNSLGNLTVLAVSDNRSKRAGRVIDMLNELSRHAVYSPYLMSEWRNRYAPQAREPSAAAVSLTSAAATTATAATTTIASTSDWKKRPASVVDFVLDDSSAPAPIAAPQKKARKRRRTQSRSADEQAMVYTTKKKYHFSKPCTHGFADVDQCTLAEALSAGLVACGKCARSRAPNGE